MRSQEVHPPSTLRIGADVFPEYFALSLDQYHQMIGAGILTDEDKVELLEGHLHQKMPRNPPHRLLVRQTFDMLSQMMEPGFHVQAQEPITLSDSEPEPDISVIRGGVRDFDKRHPGPAEVEMVIEVADASLNRDRTTKLRVYAKAQIAVYVILILENKSAEVYTNPTVVKGVATYGKKTLLSPRQSLPVILGGKKIGSVKLSKLF